MSGVLQAQADPRMEFDRVKTIFEAQMSKASDADQVAKLANFYRSRLAKLSEETTATEQRELREEIEKELERADEIASDPQAVLEAKSQSDSTQSSGLDLDAGWQKFSGSKEALKDFMKALGDGPSDPDLTPHPNIRFPFGGAPYLADFNEVFATLEGRASAQNSRVTNTEVRHPGWPYRSLKFSSHVGNFKWNGQQFNSVQLVVDNSMQVVAMQLKNDGNSEASTNGMEVAENGYYNYVLSRRKGTRDATSYYRTETSDNMITIRSMLVGPTGRIEESVVLFVPAPVAASCRSIGSRQ